MTPADHKSLLSRYAVLAIADLAAKGLGFFWTLAIIHHYGSPGFGATTFAAAVVTYALLLGSCGTDVYAVRVVANGSVTAQSMITTVVLLRLLLGVIVYAVLIGIAFVVPPLRAQLGLIALFAMSLFTGAISMNWVPQAIQRTRVLAAANFVVQALIWGLIVIAARLGYGLWSVPVAQVAAEVIVALMLLVWAVRVVGPLRQPLPRKQWHDILRQSAPIGLSQVFRTLAIGSDLLVLGFFATMEQVGWYAGANKLFLVGMASIGLYIVNLFPRLAKHAAELPPALRQSVFGSVKLIVPLATAVAIVLMIAARPVLRILFSDPAFEAAAPVLRILLVALVVSLLGAHLRNMLFAQGRQRTDFRLTVVSAISHVAFKLALVPALGMTGVALGTLLGEVLYLVAGLWVTRTELFGARPRAGT